MHLWHSQGAAAPATVVITLRQLSVIQLCAGYFAKRLSSWNQCSKNVWGYFLCSDSWSNLFSEHYYACHLHKSLWLAIIKNVLLISTKIFIFLTLYEFSFIQRISSLLLIMTFENFCYLQKQNKMLFLYFFSKPLHCCLKKKLQKIFFLSYDVSSLTVKVFSDR